jgi:hypothetical protein
VLGGSGRPQERAGANLIFYFFAVVRYLMDKILVFNSIKILKKPVFLTCTYVCN